MFRYRDSALKAYNADEDDISRKDFKMKLVSTSKA